MKDSRSEHIDLFIKRRIEHAEVQFQEEHWKKMVTLLDKELPVNPPSASGKYYSISNIITITAGAILLLALLNGSGSDWTDRMKEEDQSAMMNKLPASNEQESFANPDTLSKDEKRPDTRTENSQRTDGKSADHATKSGKRATDDFSLTRKEKIEPGVPTGPEKGARETRRLPETTADALTSDKNVGINEEGDSYFSVMIERKNFTDFPIPLALKPLRENAYDGIERTDEEVENKKERTSYFNIGPSMAPDFNSVGFAQQQKISVKGGLVVEFVFKDRWILSSGIMVNKKRYITEGENYHPPQGYWLSRTNGVIPEEVNGSCAVIDLPLNVAFNWNPASAIQLITRVGISNYFLTSERYDYQFERPNPGASTSWQTQENSKVFAGVANLSLGVQWAVRPRITLRLEPYIKVPFKDIGWGKIELYSSGTLISILYQIPGLDK